MIISGNQITKDFRTDCNFYINILTYIYSDNLSGLIVSLSYSSDVHEYYIPDKGNMELVL